MSCYYNDQVREGLYEEALLLFEKGLEIGLVTEKDIEHYVNTRMEFLEV